MTLPDQFADTSTSSYHVDAEFYARLAAYRDHFAQDWPAPSAGVVGEMQALLNHEARLVDEGRFNDWLELFSDDCLYWVPVTAGGGDPTREVSHAFDDRRRLTDRVYWLRTGLAYSQIPASRTRRIVGNVEVLDLAAGGPSGREGGGGPSGREREIQRLVRSNFLVTEFRAGVTKLYSGWYGHVLVRVEDDWKIRLKQANLLDSEQYHENLTVVF